MFTARTWMSALGCFCMLLGVGCGSTTPLSLGPLPNHELDLSASASPDVTSHPLITQVTPKPPHQWQSDGYREWRYIVIHHSAADSGNAALFDQAHRRRGWDELGYHFVITNGNGGTDGNVEVGGRWKKQKWGAHCGGTPDNDYNNHGIGICLVGDFRETLPSKQQLASLNRLVTYLAERYDIPVSNIIGHGESPNNRATACPGRYLLSWVHSTLKSNVRLAAR